MKKKTIKINKDSSGDPCYRCESMVKKGITQLELDGEHEDCHDWTHCDPQCCGSCPFCGR